MIVVNICVILLGIFLNVECQNRPNFNFPNSNKYQPCQDYSGKSGICKYFSYCPKAQKDYDSKRIQPSICWFEGREPIVCCVEDNKPTRLPVTIKTSTQKNQPIKALRICQQKCEEYYNIPKKQNWVSLVGGTPTTPREFPFMVALGWSTFSTEIDYNCGGFLVAPNYVVTVAHCAKVRGIPPKYVRVGGDNLTLSEGNVEIENIWIHPQYKSNQIYNDIAIIKLKQFVREKPACLHPTNNIQSSDFIAIGYGHTQFAGRRSDQLLKISLKVFNNQQCQPYFRPSDEFPKGIIKSQLCAGDPEKKKDTCQGDSGGPIFYNNYPKTPYIIGLTSFGQGCAGEAPSIYTRISSYLDWIEPIVWPRNQ